MPSSPQKMREQKQARKKFLRFINGRWTTTKPGVKHGSFSTYSNWMCRCVPCTEDDTRYKKEYEAKKKNWS